MGKRGTKAKKVTAKTQNEKPKEPCQNDVPNIPEPEKIAESVDDVLNDDEKNETNLDPQKHELRTDKTTQKVRKKLVMTGRHAVLTGALTNAFIECGWKTDIESYCRGALRKNHQLTQLELVNKIRLRARSLVPPIIKQNLRKRIQMYYMEPESSKDISPPQEPSLLERPPACEKSSAEDSPCARKKSSHALKKSSQAGKSSSVQKKPLHAESSKDISPQQELSVLERSPSHKKSSQTRGSSSAQKKTLTPAISQAGEISDAQKKSPAPKKSLPKKKPVVQKKNTGKRSEAEQNLHTGKISFTLKTHYEKRSSLEAPSRQKITDKTTKWPVNDIWETKYVD